MKTLGLIGGSSWVSTVDYYRGINTLVNKHLGGYASCRMILYSVNMDEFYDRVTNQGWEKTGEYLAGIAQVLEAAGAEGLVICANTPHIEAPNIQRAISMPIIHIGEATAEEIKKRGMKKVFLLGTKFTMEHGFYQAIMEKHGIEITVPNEESRDYVHHTIFHELGKDILKPGTRKRYVDLIAKAKDDGAEGVILGCTEIPLLIKEQDSPIPTLDTIEIHVKAAVEFALV
jgi:aspartate racemase